MRTRKTLIWILVIVVGAMVAIWVGNVSVVDDVLAPAVGMLLILSLMVTTWRMKRRLKERMERGLGGKVDDSQLTSITAWMRIPDEAKRAGREAEKYDFE